MTERKRAEEQQTMMVAELNHRVKNILAIVQSVAAQTMRSASTLENFADAFTGRLKALAIAHDILTQTRWIGIGLSELLVAVLGALSLARRAAHEHFWPGGPAAGTRRCAFVDGAARDDHQCRQIRRAVDAGAATSRSPGN